VKYAKDFLRNFFAIVGFSVFSLIAGTTRFAFSPCLRVSVVCWFAEFHDNRASGDPH
jgi:hypothetical protein